MNRGVSTVSGCNQGPPGMNALLYESTALEFMALYTSSAIVV
jgi:hypothetical protein